MRMRSFLLCCFFCVILGGCGEKTLSPYNPMGLSGKISSEAETLYARARVLWDKDDVCSDPSQALELLDRVIQIEPAYAPAYLRRGLAKSDLRNWDGAFDDVTKAIRLDPTAEAYAFRGLVSMRGGNFIGARKDLDRSLDMQKRQYRAWNFRGGLHRMEGNLPAACKDFEEACDYGNCMGLEMAKKAGECMN